MDSDQLTQRILDFVLQAPEPVGPTEVAGAVGSEKSNVGTILGRLVDRGQLDRPFRGAYQAPPTWDNSDAPNKSVTHVGGADRALQLLPGDETYVLTILDEERVRAACGRPNLLDQVTTRDAYSHPLSRQFFASLLGFDPPPGLRAMRTDGRSMEPGVPLGSWVVFEATTPDDRVVNGQRYIYQIEEEDTGDWSLALKRLQSYTGGGMRIISDNRADGTVDEVFTPAKRAKGETGRGWLQHKETGARVRLYLVGRILWPRDGADVTDTRTLSRMIETLASMGALRIPG